MARNGGRRNRIVNKVSGFFEHEPLIAVKEDRKLIVIEGNKRLAAIKYILNPEIADYIGINKNVLSVSEDIKQSLANIPVIIVDQGKDAWKFIGFKHINGAAKWGSYAKAQYISLVKIEYQISLIAAQIGDTHKTVQKLYQGLQAIEQPDAIGKFIASTLTLLGFIFLIYKPVCLMMALKNL